MKTVIFDLDGTLFDTEKVFWDAWYEQGEKHNLIIDKDFLIKITGSSAEDGQAILEEYPQYKTIMDLAISKGREGIQDIIKNKIDISRSGAKELLLYLNENGVKIAVASNSKLSHVEGMIATFDTKTQEAISEVVSAHEVKAGKPAPDVFLETAKRLKTDPKDIIVIEDTINGLKAAKAAGMQTILIRSVLPLTEDKKNHADYIFNDHHEILDFFKKEA